jgi:dTDP-4-amino-4,6-dideoxygalactose transaminase
MRALAERGVATRRGIMNAHQEPAWADLQSCPPLPASEAARDDVLVLPLFDGLADADQRYIIRQIRKLSASPATETATYACSTC